MSVSYSKFAEMCGVNRSTIMRAVKGNGSLKDARDGDQVNLSHPSAQDYYHKKTGQFIEIEKSHKIESITKPNKTLDDLMDNGNETIFDGDCEIYDDEPIISERNSIPHRKPIQDITNYLDIPIREIFERFGNVTDFIDFLKANQIIAAVNEKNLKNSVLEGKLISRDSVQKNFFDPVNAAHLKLMSDGAKNLTYSIKSKLLSGSDDAEIEKMASDIVASFIKPVKAKMKRALREYENAVIGSGI